MKVLRFKVREDQAIPSAGDTICVAVEGGREWLELGRVCETSWSPSGGKEVAIRLHPDLIDVRFEDGSAGSAGFSITPPPSL